MPGAGSIAGRMAEALANKALAGAPPEFFLVAACCRWPPCEARSQAIRAATQADCDWPRTLRIVQRHLVWGLAQDGIARAGIQPPAEIAENLRARAAALARRNLALAGETVRLQRRFDEADVPIIFLKGSSVAALAYGDLSLKHSLDIDILVAPARVAAAQLVLEKAGYALANPLPALTAQQFALLMRYSREWAFLARDRDMLVELHWKPSYNALLLKDIGPQSPLQQVRIGQAQIWTFRFEELFIYLCVHGAQHGWARLKWLADLAALLSARGERDIETLIEPRRPSGQAGAPARPSSSASACWRSNSPLSWPRSCADRRDWQCSKPWRSMSCWAAALKPRFTPASAGPCASRCRCFSSVRVGATFSTNFAAT